NLFRDYWRNPEATRKAFAPLTLPSPPSDGGEGQKRGWFDTGDLGQLDERGFLPLVGRSNQLIITSGYNVHPQVVERVVTACPGVRESAVFGLPDDVRGERVAVAVVRENPALDEDHLRAFWSERLVDYQRPSVVHFVEALPRNAMGKVLLGELREMLAGKR